MEQHWVTDAKQISRNQLHLFVIVTLQISVEFVFFFCLVRHCCECQNTEFHLCTSQWSELLRLNRMNEFESCWAENSHSDGAEHLCSCARGQLRRSGTTSPASSLLSAHARAHTHTHNEPVTKVIHQWNRGQRPVSGCVNTCETPTKR